MIFVYEPFFKIPMNLLYQDGANTTITVLRVPASVSEYGWMLENSHFVYMWSRESPFQTGFRPIRFLNCIGVHKMLNILKCKHGWAHEYFLCYGWNFLNRSILYNTSMETGAWNTKSFNCQLEICRNVFKTSRGHF